MTVEEKIKVATEIAQMAAELADLLPKNGSDNYTETLEKSIYNNAAKLIRN